MTPVPSSRRNGVNAACLESFTGPQRTGAWNDFIAVFVKDTSEAGRYRNRIADNYRNFAKGFVAGRDGFINKRFWVEDQDTLARRVWRGLRALAGKYPD